MRHLRFPFFLPPSPPPHLFLHLIKLYPSTLSHWPYQHPQKCVPRCKRSLWVKLLQKVSSSRDEGGRLRGLIANNEGVILMSHVGHRDKKKQLKILGYTLHTYYLLFINGTSPSLYYHRPSVAPWGSCSQLSRRLFRSRHRFRFLRVNGIP